MNSKKKITISWSGGKDSAFALYKILTSGEFEVCSLHTVIDKKLRRVGLHGVREELIEKQAENLGLPLEKIYLPASDDHALYRSIMQKFYCDCRARGIDSVVFGDIFLEDLRDFRMDILRSSKLTAIFPSWKIDSKVLISDFVDVGFKTILCSADSRYFGEHQLNLIDREFLDTVPVGVDPCGENGEFHTFVFDGPIFRRPVPVIRGEVLKKTYSYKTKETNGQVRELESSFWFQELG